MRTLLSLATRTSRFSFLLVVAALAACGDNASPTTPAAATPTPATPSATTPTASVDTELIGTWVGMLQGSNGAITASGIMTMNLNADGSMTASNTNTTFRPINIGTWGVNQNGFIASGTDTNGAVVDFLAPRSTSVLDGTFSTSTGAAGTFVITKQ